MNIFAGCATDRGNYRTKNQDRAVCHVMRRKGTCLAAACVCDGIGSFEESEIASKIVTDGITRWFTGIEGLYPDSMDQDMVLEDLELTIRELNEIVFDHRRDQGIPIGCTMSMLLLIDRSYHVFHAGDSRICRLGDRMFDPLTRDEVSMVEANGTVKALLANYIGKSPTLWLNKISGAVEGTQLFLLGTDGLFRRLKFEDVSTMAKYIRNDHRAQTACEYLLRVVMERGERDNISCILLAVTLSI